MYTYRYTLTIHTLLTTQDTYIKTSPATVLLGLQFLSLFLPLQLLTSSFVLLPLSTCGDGLESKKKGLK